MDNVVHVPVSEIYATEEELALCPFLRANPSVPPISCHRIPDVAILDQKYDLLDYNVVRTHFIHEGKLSLRQITKIISDATKVLSSEPNLIHVDKKCYIFGDIHGQFYDLVSILEKFDLSCDTLVFVGDYVDRGHFSFETYIYLLLLKSHYPDNIILLRGNHESIKMTTYFTFRNECITKYNQGVYEQIAESFKTLPLAAVVQNKAFCVHGGISPLLGDISAINEINRFVEPEYEGIMCDLLWSDPIQNYDEETEREWEENNNRRCSFVYCYKSVVKFLEKNSLSTIIRGHEVQMSGCTLFKEHNNEPTVVSVFTAPNYCDFYGNSAAVVDYDMGIKSILQFSAVKHPFVLPASTNGLTWSVPLVSEKIIDLLVSLIDFAASKPLDIPVQSSSSKFDCPSTPEVDYLTESFAALRFEQEAAAEVEAVSGPAPDLLDVAHPDVINFDEAIEKDSPNEIKKDETEETSTLAMDSPSEQPSTPTACAGTPSDSVSQKKSDKEA